jgi:putative hydrolase of the HAD superfamily
VTEDAPAAIFLDLFGTIVFFDASRLPRREIAGKDTIMTIPDIDDLLAELGAGVALEDFLRALREVSMSIAQEKAADHREITSIERFRRTIATFGEFDAADSVAQRCVEAHMASLAASVTCPEDRREILSDIARRYPLALVSNFDHAPTARAILEREGLTRCFDEIIISDEVGVCKPHPEIFHHAARALSVNPRACLHVGDSKEADIDGAVGAGLRALRVATPQERETHESHSTIEDIAHLKDRLPDTGRRS